MIASAKSISVWFINNNKDIAYPSFDGNVKLQKLLHYSKAMYYAVYGDELFPNSIEAWENGPVVREIFTLYRYHDLINEAKLKADKYSLDPKVERVLRVVNYVYGTQTSAQLIELTHQEEPWKNLEEQAKRRQNPVIREDVLKSYYQPLKDIYESVQEEEIDNIVNDKINGNVFSYDRYETDLTNDDLEFLYRLGVQNKNQNFFVYKDDDGELVVY